MFDEFDDEAWLHDSDGEDDLTPLPAWVYMLAASAFGLWLGTAARMLVMQ